MWLSKAEAHVPCTLCPLPCGECHKGAYCQETPCFCLCHKDLPWYNSILSWYEGPLTKERVAKLRQMLAKARGVLMSFLDEDPQFHPTTEEIKKIIKETDGM